MHHWGWNTVILNLVVSFNLSGEVLKLLWQVILASVGHDPLLVPFFVDVKHISIWISVPGSILGFSCDGVVEGWELSGLSLGDQRRSAWFQILESEVWVHGGNDVLTHGCSHEQVFVVHASVTKDHVAMVLGIKVD